MTERLISADSHVSISHDQVKAHLATKHHDDYDDAQRAFAERMRNAMGAGRANTDSMKQNAHAAFTRPGYRDGPERLKDMDTDGVDAEVVYSEVSAFRYIGDMRDGAGDATRAFNDVMSDFASADPKRLLVSYQIPIHDIDDAVREVQRVAAGGAKSLQLPVFPTEIGLPDYYDERYDPLWATIQDVGPADLLPHRPQHQPRRSDPPRPDPPEGGHGPDGRALHRRGVRHVDPHRRARPVPPTSSWSSSNRASAGSPGTSTSSTTW